MTPVDLSIIICTLNRSSLLKKCLESLVQQECASWKFEIVLVDNGSTDDTKKVAEAFVDAGLSIKYLYESRKCIGYARNIGLRASEGRYLATLDDDVTAVPNWCEAVCRGFEQNENTPLGKIGAVGGPIEPIFETGRPPWLTPELEALYAVLDLGSQQQIFRGVHHPVQANVAFLRSVLLDNPWNENVLMCEEIELFGRLTRKGFRYLYVPEMKVYHFISARRLNSEWLMNRHFAEGVASRYLAVGICAKVRPLVRSVLKLPYAWGRSHLGSEPRRLPFRCKTMLHVGTLAGLLGFRDVESTTYASARKNATF